MGRGERFLRGGMEDSREGGGEVERGGEGVERCGEGPVGWKGGIRWMKSRVRGLGREIAVDVMGCDGMYISTRTLLVKYSRYIQPPPRTLCSSYSSPLP